MAYITKQDIETAANIDLTAEGETLADVLIPAVEAAANAYANRRWGVTDGQTETFDGGKAVYFPSVVPIASVASVTVDGEELTTDRYAAYPGYVRLLSPATRGLRNVVIAYTPGSPLPADVKLALARWAGELITAATSATSEGGKNVKRARFGPGEVEYFAPEKAASDVPESVTKVLDRYRLAPV